MIMINISEIIVEDRIRKVYGWLDSLERSIEQFGVLQPIGITSDKKLIFGGRRLQACINLGQETVPARIFDIDADNPVVALQIEREENEHRLDLLTSEKVDLGRRIEEAMGNRQGQRTDVKLPPNLAEVDSGNEEKLVADLPQVELGTKTRDIAAKAVGMKPTTYRKAKEVVDSGNQTEIQAMDSGEKSIDAAYESVRKTPRQRTFKVTLYRNPEDDAEVLLAKGGHEYCTKLALAILKAAGHKVT